MSMHHGGCLCGAVRYATAGKPLRVTFCHCRFCQRATGSAYMVEPIFEKANFEITSGTPAIYALASHGSGKQVSIHFCATCGTKLFLAFERFPGILRRLWRNVRRSGLVRTDAADIAAHLPRLRAAGDNDPCRRAHLARAHDAQ